MNLSSQANQTDTFVGFIDENMTFNQLKTALFLRVHVVSWHFNEYWIKSYQIIKRYNI